MEIKGIIRKMTAASGDRVQYQLPLGEVSVEMNALIGSHVEMVYQGRIHCIRCGRETRKSFAQGYCYPCFTTAPETEECVLRPELCRAHEGVARDMSYARSHCLIEHVVYLSMTSGLKVGVTRNTQVPTRWIDQGAVAAIELARTPNRFEAGRMEVALKSMVSDKTNWRRMLAEVIPVSDELLREKERLISGLPEEMEAYISPDQEVTMLSYPVMQYPTKLKSFNFDTDPVVSGVLTGIKGQYLIFSGGGVINLRKFGGYEVLLRIKD